jgi:hypothetical protein
MFVGSFYDFLDINATHLSSVTYSSEYASNQLLLGIKGKSSLERFQENAMFTVNFRQPRVLVIHWFRL